MRSKLNLLLLALLLNSLVGFGLRGATYVVPPAYQNVEAICGAGDLVHTVRDQTIYSSLLFTNGLMLIQELRFRPCTGSSAFTNILPSVQINLSTTPMTPSGASTTYANNLGADNTVVFQGAASLYSRVTGPPGQAKEFDIIFPLTTPFLYNPVAGNLLVDLRHNTSDAATYLDVSSSSDGRTARIFSVDPNAASGAKDSAANIIQLVLVESNTPPYIGTQPQSQSAQLSNTVTFNVAAGGSSPLHYQWAFNGGVIPNATNAALSLTNASLSQTGIYSVTITNLYGSRQSSNATLLLYAVPPGIASQPQSQKVVVGANVSFSIMATGSPPLGYQWSFEGAPIINATNPTLTLNSVTVANEGQYRAAVTSPYGSALSDTVTLQFFEPSSFYDHPEPPGPCNRRSPLVISEIMYHPLPRTDGREAEFVEIYNSGAVPMRLDGYHLTGEWDFTFPANTTLGANSYLVIAPIPDDIQVIYGIANVLGGFPKKLANNGGTIRLRSNLDAVLVDVNYSDTPPWPVAVDGAGHSLVMARPSLGERNPLAWAASAAVGGSPGGPDPIPAGAQSRMVINEILAHTNGAAAFVELFNRGATAVNLSGCVLTDDATTNRFRLTDGATIPARDWLSFSAAQLGFIPDASGGTIYLINSNATRVLDALRVGAQRAGVSHGRWPDGAPNWRELKAASPAGSNAAPGQFQIVINEIMYHPISHLDDDQFVELYNHGTNSMNLDGWKLSDGVSFTFPSNTTIAAQGYLVVARNSSRMMTNYPNLNAANLVGNFQGTLSWRGERIVLTKPEQFITAASTGTIHTVVNEVTYGTGGRWGQWADGGGASLELTDPNSDNQLAANWTDSTAPTNAPWTTIEYTGPHEFGDLNTAANGVEISLLGAGECLVDDVEVIPNGGANRVTNPGFASGASGWTFEGNCEPSGIDASGGMGNTACLHIRASGRGDYLGNRILTTWTTALNTGTPATLRLKVRWLRGWPEILMRLRGNTIEATGPLTLPTNLGTPGAANSRLVTNAPPAIWDVSHTPVLPAANQPVVVTTRVHDAHGVTNVSLIYRIDPSATTITNVMRDDGTGGDLAARDGIFSATVPGQAGGALVAFYVRAADATGMAARFPNDAPTRECLIRFGEVIPAGSFGTYRVWMTAATKSTWINRSSARINGRPLDVTFVYNDQRAIYNAGGAYNGSDNTSEGYNGPDATLCGYTFSFPADDLFLNTDEILLDWPTRDLTAQREQLSYWMAAQVGLPFNYRRHVRLYVNGVGAASRPQVYGNGTQIYEDLQTPGSDFLESWFPEGESDLYKIQAWRRDYKFPARPSPNGESYYGALQSFIDQAGRQHLARHRWTWRKRAIKESANEYSTLFNLIAVGNATSSPNYFSAVDSFMNVEQWMRVLAWERVIGNLDSYGNRTGQNMYGVKPPGKRWQLLPFDSDLCFGADPGGSEDPTSDLFGISPSAPPTDSGVPDPVAITRLRDGSPAGRRAYWRAFQDFVNGPMQPSNYLAEANAKYSALLANGVVQDNGTPVSNPSPVSSWIDQRRAYIQSQLNSVATSFAVATPPGNHTTNRNLVTLTGTAPVDVQTIAINGIEANVNWTSATAWSLQVVLTNGANPIAIDGLDRFGNTNFSSSRTVNFTGTNAPPEQSLVLNELMYRPSVTNAEFLEIFNRSTTTAFDLANWRVNGLSVEFKHHTILAPAGFLVVAKSAINFGRAYGFQIPVAAEFDGEIDPDGETLSLIRRSGTNEYVVDAVTFGTMPPWPVLTNGSGRSLQLIDAAQDNNRIVNWAGSTATPGATNSVAVSLPSIPMVWLNELQPANLTGITDNLGEREPWLELFNAGTGTVSLASFYLTTNYTSLTRWALPAVASMAAQTFKLVWLDGQTNQGTATDLHASFRPSPVTGSVALVWVNGGRTSVLDYLNYSVSGPDHSFGAYPDAQPHHRHDLYFATPGATNSDALPLPNIRINEWMAANTHTVVNPVNGSFDDWFELFNASSNAVDLIGYSLTDDLTRPAQYIIATNVVILSGGFRLVWAEGNARPVDANGGLHVNFKLSAFGETIALFAPNLQPVDIVQFSLQTNDVSQGLWPDGAAVVPHFMLRPTPHAPNTPPNPQLVLLAGDLVIGTNGTVTLQWTSQPTRVYRVQFKNDLESADWTDLPGDTMATTLKTSKNDTTAAGVPHRFYRIFALP